MKNELRNKLEMLLGETSGKSYIVERIEVKPVEFILLDELIKGESAVHVTIRLEDKVATLVEGHYNYLDPDMFDMEVRQVLTKLGF